MTEKITLIMPEYLEDFLYCTGILHGYRAWLMGHGRNPEFTILCRPEWVPLVRPAVPANVSFGTHLNDESKAADFVFEFDRQRAYDWSLPSKAQAGIAYGTLLGAGANMGIPVYGRMNRDELPRILVLPRHRTDFKPEIQWKGMYRLDQEFRPRTTLQIGILDPKATLQFTYEAISAAALCVGVAGGLTLLAASLGKPLLEIYPTDLYHENWCVKWDLAQSGNPLPNYRVIRDTLNHISTEFVSDSLVKMLTSLCVRKSPLWVRYLKGGQLWQKPTTSRFGGSVSSAKPTMTAR
jgi:hypothetical protein